MRMLLYLVSGIIFALGLSISGMIDPLKVKNFLAIGTTDWSPALAFVLGSSIPIYYIAFIFLRKREITLNGNHFGHPAPRPIDKRLVIGSIIFGVGWGIAGVCPGPAIVHMAFLNLHFLAFILAMVVGFELQRRLLS